ncbi:MAG: hypothetical protein VW230_04955 [Candidatus Poseidoniales archaeon]
MALTDWLRRFFSSAREEVDDEPLDEDDLLREQFNDMKEEFEQSAEVLFEDDDDTSIEEKVEVATPEYDVGEVDVNVILASNDMEDFSTTNEVHIVDVSTLEDPYEDAEILGDISHQVDL